MIDNFDLFKADALSDEEWFQNMCIRIFSEGDGKKFVDVFNKIMLHSPITFEGVNALQITYRDGFFHLIREINLSIYKFNEKNRSK